MFAITIDHPSGQISLRNWRFRSPYRTGFEDWQYDQCNANPYPRIDPRWQKYENGNKEARRQRGK